MLDRRFDHGQIEAVIQQHLLERIDVGDGGRRRRLGRSCFMRRTTPGSS